MKKLTIILALVLSIQCYSKKSEAGVVIFGTGVVAAKLGQIKPIDVIGYGIGGTAVALFGLVTGGVVSLFNQHAGLNVMLIGFALDADQKFPRSNVEQFFSARYSFIDNQKTIQQLTKEIENEYQQGSNEVHFSEEQIENLFESAELTAEQDRMIKNDLL